jgi:glycosyltransferase involved in cell wall biosynthesis
MDITVILCTYSRSQSLAKALGSVAASELPDSIKWEVLIVDNNSKDQTREVAEGFCDRYPGRFRYLFERKQGKSNALNAGIREARGGILAFMDDDVIVAPTWLLNITAPLGSSEWAGTGGRICAQELFTTPPWLSLEGEFSMAGMLALFDLGDQACELKTPPYGTNMAFRKTIFERYGGFRTDMGPCPGSELRNEDTEFGHRVMAAGGRLWYAPSAVVYHAVPEDRLTQRYFLRFSYDHGRALVRERGYRPSVYGIPRWFFSVPIMLAFPFPISVRIWLKTKDPKARFFKKGDVWKMMGEMVEMPRVWWTGIKQIVAANLGQARNQIPKVGSSD